LTLLAFDVPPEEPVSGSIIIALVFAGLAVAAIIFLVVRRRRRQP